MSVFKDNIWKQILDGEREWKVSGPTTEAADLFECEVVVPLRELSEEGAITIQEIKAPSPGRYRVVEVLLLEVVRSDR